MTHAGGSLLGDVAQTAIDGAAASIAVLDDAGIIVAVNEFWIRFGAENDRPDAGSDRGSTYPVQAVPGLAEVLAGTRPNASMVYDCHSPEELRWFRLIAMATARNPRRILVVHRRLSDAPTEASMIPVGEELTLRWEGIRTVCGWCQVRGRDSLGVWRPIEVTPVGLVSHGLCGNCLDELIGPGSVID